MGVRIEYIDDCDHEWYHKKCAICTLWLTTQRVAIGVADEGRGIASSVMHRSCLEDLLVDAPLDNDARKVRKIVQEEAAGGGLLAWVLSNDGP